MNSVAEYKVNKRLMGCNFELIVADSDYAKAQSALQTGIKEVERIEDLLSEFKPSSQTSAINLNAGKSPVNVDDETYQLVKRCKEISRITQGAFDITVGPLKRLYQFNNHHAIFPSSEKINEALSKTGNHYIQLVKNNQVFLKHEGMRISFAAIGKGYAADRVMKMWKETGIHSGVINASGDLTVWGNRADGSKWKVGIAHPDNKNETISWLSVPEGCIATSGDYEQYFIQNGIRYSHNINPKTGMPLKGIKSVTVISISAELSDALCTAVYVMGVDTGLHFINQLPRTHCIIIDNDNNLHHSGNLNITYG